MTLQKKVAASFGVLILVMVLYGGYSVLRQRAMLLGESHERARVLVDTLAEMAREPLVSRQFDVLERHVDSLLTHPDVRYARILNDEGRVVADTQRDRQGWVYTRPLVPIAQELYEGHDLAVAAFIAVQGATGARVFGRAEVGVSLERARRRVYSSTVVLVAVLAAQLALGVAFGWFLQVQVVRPLHGLAGTLAVSAPNVAGQHIPTPRHAAAEIRTVTEAINSMRSRLERFYDDEREQQRLRTLGEISVSLAHEIRNPLEAVGGAVEVLRRSPAITADHLRFLDIIREEVDNLNRYVSEFLRYGRFDARDEGACDLRRLTDEAILLVSPLLHRRHIEPRVIHPPQPVTVWVSADQMKRVLVNLLMNAIDVTPERGTIETHVTEIAGRARVEVRDAGPGIPDALLEEVFEPYVTTKQHGAGLGLSLCRTIVERHAGRIGLDNNPAGGARAWVELPLHATPAATPAEAQKKDS